MVVPVYKFGARLGNRLFIFAHLIAFSHEHRLRVCYPAFDEYGPFFKGTVNDVFCRYPRKESLFKFNWLRFPAYVFYKVLFKPFRVYRPFNGPLHSVISADFAEFSLYEEKHHDMNDDSFVKEAKRKLVVFLHGRFFRDYGNMEKHQEIIRSFFSPIDPIQKRIDDFYREFSRGADITVGVHIRGEDYREFIDGKYYYTQEQYYKKMKEALGLFPGKKVRFLICTNHDLDMNGFEGLDIRPGPGEVIEDLYSLAKCDYIMGPPSSFSLWSSFYGRKPLYWIWNIDNLTTRDGFRMLPPKVLFNWGFPYHGTKEYGPEVC